MSSFIHGSMAAGFVFGRWEGGQTLLGILLDSLIAYVLWLFIYVRLRPVGRGVLEVMAKTFVGLSCGVWGFIGMFRAITAHDASLLAANVAIFEVIGNLGDALDNDVGAVIVVIIAAALLVASLYFLAKMLVVTPWTNVAGLVGSIVVMRLVQVVRYWRRHRENSFTEKVNDAEDHLSELCLDVFVKGWGGALIMYMLVDVDLSLTWIYLVWSYAHDLLLRRWLWGWLGQRIKKNVLARRASRLPDREARPVRAKRAAKSRQL